MAAILCVPFAGCRNFTTSGKAEWTKEDFSFYDSTGKEADFATTQHDTIWLTESNKKAGSNLQTKRNVKIGDRATTALSNYDLKNFDWGIGYNRSATDEEKKYLKELKQKYKTISEAVEHSDEFLSGNSYLYVIGYFISKGSGPLQPSSEKELPPNAEKFEIDFQIQDEKISEITVTDYKIPKLPTSSITESISESSNVDPQISDYISHYKFENISAKAKSQQLTSEKSGTQIHVDVSFAELSDSMENMATEYITFVASTLKKFEMNFTYNAMTFSFYFEDPDSDKINNIEATVSATYDKGKKKFSILFINSTSNYELKNKMEDAFNSNSFLKSRKI